jgi:hypothetical protein
LQRRLPRRSRELRPTRDIAHHSTTQARPRVFGGAERWTRSRRRRAKELLSSAAELWSWWLMTWRRPSLNRPPDPRHRCEEALVCAWCRCELLPRVRGC